MTPASSSTTSSNNRVSADDHILTSIRIVKVGMLSRKEEVAEGGKKRSRKWRGYTVLLTGTQLLFFVSSCLSSLASKWPATNAVKNVEKSGLCDRPARSNCQGKDYPGEAQPGRATFFTIGIQARFSSPTPEYHCRLRFYLLKVRGCLQSRGTKPVYLPVPSERRRGHE